MLSRYCPCGLTATYITNYVKALKANLLGEGGWGNLIANEDEWKEASEMILHSHIT